MFHLAWKDRYNINYKDIDDQHRRLLAILNELADLHGQAGDAERVAEIIHRLCEYALTHFATEERYMAAAGYPGLSRQQSEHATFIQQLLALNQSFEPGDQKLVAVAFNFVKDWYLNHILRSDMDYAACLKGYRSQAKIKGIIFNLTQVICQFSEERFQADCGKPEEGQSGLNVNQMALLRLYDEGSLETQVFQGRFSDLIGTTPDGPWLQAYSQVFTPVEPAIELIRRLKPNYKLGLVADTTPLRLEHCLATMDILPLFDAVVLPWELKVSKVDGPVIKDLLDQMGLVSEECIWVDPLPAVALAATRHLFHGIAAPDFDALKANLHRLGVGMAEGDESQDAKSHVL